MISSRAGHVGIVRPALAQKTQASGVGVAYLRVSLRRAVTNSGNSSKFFVQVEMRRPSDTGDGCLAVS